jgi:hypothetical protein
MNEILPANATINSDLLSDQDSGYGRDIDRIPRSRGSASRSTTPTSYQDSDYDSDIDRVLLKSQRESRKRALPDGKQRIFKRVKTSRISFELLPGEMQDMVRQVESVVSTTIIRQLTLRRFSKESLTITSRTLALIPGSGRTTFWLAKRLDAELTPCSFGRIL